MRSTKYICHIQFQQGAAREMKGPLQRTSAKRCIKTNKESMKESRCQRRKTFRSYPWRKAKVPKAVYIFNFT